MSRKLCLNKQTKDADVIVAAKDLLDRAGVKAEKPADASAHAGTVLWEEFVQIHRRRVLERAGEAGVIDAETVAE
jgi:hypothetical protein